MNLNLFHPVIEDSYAATVPAHPDLATDIFSGNFLKGACHLDVTVVMDVASDFLQAGKKRVGQRLKAGAFPIKTGCDLLTRCPMDTFVSTLPLCWGL
jgi:hypothetical protein